MSSLPLKLAVLGDSRASNFGCDPDVLAFPEVLAELVKDDYEVRSFARPALRLDRYLKELPELIAWQPDVVISAFGGRESMYRMAGWLRHVPCDPAANLKGKGLRLPAAWVRRQVWRSMLGIYARRPATYERAMQLIGAHTYRTAEQYREALESLLAAVAAIPAGAILMETFPSTMREFPLCPSQRDKNVATARSLAGRFPERVRMWDPKLTVDFTGLFLGDGIHLNPNGHRTVARALAAEVTKTPSPVA
jgi:hypothetical protein